MYTKEQLQAMSDMQVLRKLYELLGFEVHEYEFNEVIRIRNVDKVTTAEMCPNDIMPLAFEHKLSVISAHEDLYAAYADKIEPYVAHKNPLRAIACCLILVLQGRDK